MSDQTPATLRTLVSRLEIIGEASRGLAKKIAAGDPFVALRLLRAAQEGPLSGALSDIDAVARELEDECRRHRTGFWDSLASNCAARGWSIAGTTSRRIVASGLLVELTDDEVRIVESGLVLTPFVPSVLDAIANEGSEIDRWRLEPQRFLELLASAYDETAGSGEGERSLETVFRAAVWRCQKPSFWRTLQAGSFTRLSRAAFRAGLAAAMAAGTTSKDGRKPRFGTAVSGEQWEVFSPGEGHIVQVGRIAFVRAEL